MRFNNPADVAECLIDNGDLEGYELSDQFSAEDVRALALESARSIIDARQELRQQRVRAGIGVRTVYLATVTDLSKRSRISA